MQTGNAGSILLGESIKNIRKEYRGYCKEKRLPGYGWKIFECTGTKVEQDIGLKLLSFTTGIKVERGFK